MGDIWTLLAENPKAGYSAYAKQKAAMFRDMGKRGEELLKGAGCGRLLDLLKEGCEQTLADLFLADRDAEALPQALKRDIEAYIAVQKGSVEPGSIKDLGVVGTSNTEQLEEDEWEDEASSSDEN